MSGHSERFLAFYDLHVPEHDPLVVDKIVAAVKEFEPDHIINGGDGIEAIAASRWPHEKDASLSFELSQLADIKKRIRESAPDKCKFHWVRGNHDDNVIAEGRIPKNLRDLYDWDKNHKIFPEFALWKQHAYETRKSVCTYRIGQVLFMHGFEASEARLNAQMYEYCDPWGLLVSGHTHRPTELIQAEANKVKIPFWRITSGCGQDFRDAEKVTYMRRKSRANWGHGIVCGDVYPTKSPRAGRYWDAWPVIWSTGAEDDDSRNWKPRHKEGSWKSDVSGCR